MSQIAATSQTDDVALRQNKASASLVNGVGSSRKRRCHDDEADSGFASSRKKLKWHEPTDPWAAQDRWPADGVYDYYTRDYVNGTASSGTFRLNRADSCTTVTSSAGSRAAGDTPETTQTSREKTHFTGRMSTLSQCQPQAEARDRVTSQSGSANEATTTDVHRRTASRAALHAAPFSAAARGDATDGISRRRHTIENTDVAATTRSGRRGDTGTRTKGDTTVVAATNSSLARWRTYWTLRTATTRCGSRTAATEATRPTTASRRRSRRVTRATRFSCPRPGCRCSTSTTHMSQTTA